MKMPTIHSIDPTVSALRPYSRLTTSSRVEHPLRRKGPAYTYPNNNEPIAAPAVNHQADIP